MKKWEENIKFENIIREHLKCHKHFKGFKENKFECKWDTSNIIKIIFEIIRNIGIL